MFAWERQATYLQSAVEVVTDTDPDRLVALLLALGRARKRAGEVPAASETLQRAAGVARTGKLFERLAEAALAFGEVQVVGGVVDPALVSLLQEALTVVGEQNSALRAALLARLAEALHQSSSPDDAGALSREAVAVAGGPTLRRHSPPPCTAAL